MLDTVTLDDRYRVERLIGRGGTADVYLAEDEELGRKVAVKILRARLVDDQRSVDRIRREARRSAALNHPNIVQVHDTGTREGAPYIVMEYVPGSTLADRTEDGALSVDEAVSIAIDIARALCEAHRQGTVHADIKPANVLFTSDGTVKVADFGIARALGDDGATQTSVLGTAAYISPEQAQGDALDARADVYSLGAVLYEMIAGRPPFTGSSVVEVVRKHVEEQPEPLGDHIESADHAVAAVVMRAMSKDPDVRYEDAGEMLRDLERVERGAGTTGLLEPTQRIQQRDRSGRGQLALVVLGVLALLAAGAFWMITPTQAETAEVPDLQGMTLDEAHETLSDRRLQVGEVRVVPADVATGTVVRHQPPPGSTLEEGEVVDLVLAGPREPPETETDEPDETDRAEGRTDGDQQQPSDPDGTGSADGGDTTGGQQEPPPGREDDPPPGHGGEPPGQEGGGPAGGKGGPPGH